MKNIQNNRSTTCFDDKHWVRDLNVKVLTGWWRLATRALEEAAGFKRSSEAIRPYMEHAGRAGYLVLKERMGWTDDSMTTVMTLSGAAHMLLKKPINIVRVKGESEGYLEFDECPFEDASNLACVAICYDVIRGVANGANPDFYGDLLKTVKNGDDYCLKCVRNSKTSVTSNEEKWVDIMPDISSISDAEKDYFFCAYMGEFLIITIRAFNDLFGIDRTLEILGPRFKEYGHEIGSEMKNEIPWPPGEIRLSEMLDLVRRGLMQETDPSIGKSNTQIEIKSCPFSGSPAPTCEIIESFLKGISESIDPSILFASDKKMREDKNTPCQWTFLSMEGKKDNVLQSEKGSDDPLRILQTRFAKGELTKEEYSEMKRTLIDG